MRTLAIVAGVIVVLAVAGVIYLQWLNFNVTQGPESGNPKLEVTVDKEKAKEDLKAVQKKAEEIKDEVKEKVQDLSAKTVTGKVSMVDAEDAKVMVKTTEDEEVAVKLNTETKVRVGERDGTIRDLAPGDAVTVAFVSVDKENLARTIQVDVPK